MKKWLIILLIVLIPVLVYGTVVWRGYLLDQTFAQLGFTKLSRRMEAPAFNLDTANKAGRMTLEQYRGKMVILFFWQSTMPAAEQQARSIDELYKLYGRKLEILAINIMQPIPFVQSLTIGFDVPILMDTNGKTANEYSVPAVPFAILIDTRGRIMAYSGRILNWASYEMKDFVEKVLRCGPPKRTGKKIEPGAVG